MGERATEDVLIKLNEWGDIRPGDGRVVVAGADRCEQAGKFTHGNSVAGTR